MKLALSSLTSVVCVAGLTLAVMTGKACGQQVPIPTTAAQVSGPVSGTAMTKEYVQMLGRTAYFWGYAIVATSSRRDAFAKAPERIYLGGVLPMAPIGDLTMLHDYISPEQSFIVCPNQDVVYGGGFAALEKEPMVFQVSDFGERFWVYPIYDNRTNEIGRIGQQYGTKPGFYMIVGPNWKGKVPGGITAIVRSPTDLAFPIPRIQMDDTAEDKKAIQAPLSKVMFYPLSQFDGKMKTTDWSKIPSVPVPAGPPNKWVDPETYFDQLPAVLKQVVAGPEFRLYLTNSPKLFVEGNVYGMYLGGYGNFVSSSDTLGLTVAKHLSINAGYQLGSRLVVNNSSSANRIGVRLTQHGAIAGLELSF